MPQNNRPINEYLDLDNKVKLPQNGHTQNVYRVKKKKPQEYKNENSHKYEKTWILKEVETAWMDNFNEPVVFASELYRLWSLSKLPKTRLVQDHSTNPPKNYILSEEVTNYKNYDSLETQDLLNQNHTAGFASLLVTSLTLAQADLNTRDIGIDAQNNFIHFDDDHCLGLIWKDVSGDGYQFDFTSRDLDMLPLIHDYAPLQWLDYQRMSLFTSASQYESKPLPQLVNIASDPAFNKEKHFTILKIILTPDNVLKAMTDFYIKDEKQNQLIFNFLKQRKLLLEKKALELAEFRHFISKYGKQALPHIINKLKQFTLTGKQKLISITAQFENEMAEKSKILFNKDMLEQYILTDNNFLPERRPILIGMLTDKIEKAKSIEETIAVITAIETAPQYKLIRERQDNFGLSFWGYSYKGKPISKSFSDLIKLAKNKIATMIIKHPDPQNLQILNNQAHDVHKFLAQKRTRFATTNTETLKDLKKAIANKVA